MMMFECLCCSDREICMCVFVCVSGVALLVWTVFSRYTIFVATFFRSPLCERGFGPVFILVLGVRIELESGLK